MTELITIILTVVGVGLSIAAINVTTFFYLLGRLTKVEKGLATVGKSLVALKERLLTLEKGQVILERRLATVEKEVAFIHGLLIRRTEEAVVEQ